MNDDESGIVCGPCPLCEAWQVEVAFAVAPWPLAGLLVEQAIAEHVDDDLARFAAANGRAR